MLKCPVMTLHIEDTGGHWRPHAVTPLSMDVIGMMGRASSHDSLLCLFFAVV